MGLMATVQGRFQDSRILAECSWRGLLQVSAMHEQQARLLIHSRDSLASAQFECGSAHAFVATHQ